MTWNEQRREQQRRARTIAERCDASGRSGSLLATDDTPPVYIGTVVAMLDEAGRTVTATKAGHEGYEFGGMDTFPGGRVRRVDQQPLPEAIATTAIERLVRETGIRVSRDELTIRFDLCVPTRYTDLGGDDTFCIIVPATRLGEIPEPSVPISASSISGATVAPLASSIKSMAHANMLIGGDLLCQTNDEVIESDLAVALAHAFAIVESACAPFMSQVP